ncbi:ATP-binding protein [Thalassorhabdus alkalitolerans]|uniref:GAF domain-containing sensor histidine kinase n=1 Tax=Thalassorhabdus alkalitolerans TaxID=2282697 RepID=UPI0036154525
MINNIQTDERAAHVKEDLESISLASYLGVPIILENGELFGTLCASDTEPYDFTEKEIESVKRLANVLSSVISQEQQVTLPVIEDKMKLLDKQAMVGKLAAGLAHEIRNPMQTIKGFIELLFADNKEMAHYHEIVIEELNRLNKLVSDFLLTTQPSAPKKEKISPYELLRQTMYFMESEFHLHNIEFNLLAGNEPPSIYLDPSQMKQVFLNIFKNSIEAIEENGKVDIELTADINWVTVFVKDNGRGIPLSLVNKIGDPFFSTKEEGTGLGLSICKTIIKEHQGSLDIENHPEGGTLVSVRLPINAGKF